MFLSEKAESLLARYRKAAPSLNGDTAELLAEMASLLAEACVQIDMLALKADEVSEKVDQTTDHLEAVNSNLQTIRDRIVGEIRVDAPDYGEDEDAEEDCGCDDEDCDCHHHTHAHAASEEMVTLQCCFCEEIFLVDAETASAGTAVCPFCQRRVPVRDCLVE